MRASSAAISRVFRGEGLLVARAGIGGEIEGCGGHQLALPLQRGFEVMREPDGLQRVLTDQCDRILGLAGKMDDAGRQQVHDGEREGDGAVELGCNLRPRQPQPVEHGVPARRS